MSRSLPDEDAIVRCLSAQPRALHLSEVASRLSVPSAGRRGLRRELDRLVSVGSLRQLKGQRYRAARRAATESWEGGFSANARGFGFVTAPGRDDVYVAPKSVGPALHGDTVVVEVVARTSRGVEGRIQSVVRRGVQRVAGVLRRRARSAWLEPDDDRIRGPIVITTRPVEGSDGDAAVVVVTRHPDTADENPEAELIEVLGRPGEAQVEVRKILAREGIEDDYDPRAVQQAERRAARLSAMSLEHRRDLREVPLLTIDPVDARDHDDAVWVERRPDGYRAYVAIADVSEYVQENDRVDVEAARRCFTTYLPDRAVPMLPSALAAQYCSLLPGVERHAMCGIADLDRAGVVKRFRLVEAVVRVAAKLSYQQVAAALGPTDKSRVGADENPALAHRKALRVLVELTRKLRRARMKRGALDLDLPEPRVQLDGEGHPVAVTRRATDPAVADAYRMIEEMMLLCNERVARWLKGRRSPGVHRVHGAPDEEKLARLGVAARVLGMSFDKEALAEPRGVSRWLERIAKHPAKPVLEGLLLRSLKMAQYQVDNIGHFGLAADAYVHFTSPIRRYPDLLVHRIAKSLLRGQGADRSEAAIEALEKASRQASETERRVLSAEREVVDVYRCLFMRDHLGEVCEGRVTGLSGSGVYLVLDEPFVDVLVRFESLGSDRYEPSDDGLSVHGVRSGDRVSLGDRFVVVIEDVALERRTIYGRRLAADGAQRHPAQQRRPAARSRDGRGRDQRRDQRSGSRRRRR